MPAKPFITVGLRESSLLIQKVKKNMTKAELQEWEKVERSTSRMWRNFWICVLRNHGHTNVEIAEAFGLTEGTIRAITKGA